MVLQSSNAYWCHTCRLNIQVNTSNTGDVECVSCNGSFVEEIPESDSFSTSNLPQNFIPEGVQVNNQSNISSSTIQRRRNAMISSNLFQNEGTGIRNSSSPFNFALATSISALVQQVITQLESHNRFGLSRRTPISVYLHTTTAGGRFLSEFRRMGLSDRSYDQLLHELLMNSGRLNNPPPTAKSVLKKLKENKKIISFGDAVSETLDCAVCKDDFKVGAEVLELECSHKFCESCIIPWLESHNTCPVCRKEFLTDDIEYEARKESERVTTSSNETQE